MSRLVELEDEFAAADLVESSARTDIDDVIFDNEAEKVILDSLANVARQRSAFTELEPDFRELYERAERAEGPVAGAVGDAARAWIVYGHGLELADEALSHDLGLPRGNRDGDGVATGADYAGGVVDAALLTVLEANDRLELAHIALATVDLDPAIDALMDVRVQGWIEYRQVDEPVYAALLSQPATQVIIATERFSGALGNARARTIGYACIDRDAYLGGVTAQDGYLADLAAIDCLNLAGTGS